MKVVGILPELPVMEIGKEKKTREKSRAIEKGDKFSKGLLITLVRIWAKESMAYLFGIIWDNLSKMTRGTPLLKFLIKSALISLLVVSCQDHVSIWSIARSGIRLISGQSVIVNSRSIISSSWPIIFSGQSIIHNNRSIISAYNSQSIVSSIPLATWPSICSISGIIRSVTMYNGQGRSRNPVLSDPSPCTTVGAEAGTVSKEMRNGDDFQKSCLYWL